MSIDFTSKAGKEISDITRKVKEESAWLESRGRTVIDVDFFIDDDKFLRYRAIIKHKESGN